MDARIAQIVAVLWATFMFAPTLPLLYPLSVMNLTVIYWYDKWLVLRHYQTPKNYDENIILTQVNYLKYTFIFHFGMGLWMLSNNAILSSESLENESETINNINKWGRETIGFNFLSDQF